MGGTKASLDSAEATLGHSWDLKLLQTQSDPINDSTGEFSEYPLPKNPLGYKIDYFVPNFGVDNEVAASAASLSETEKLMEHKFNLPDPDNQKPGYDTDYFVPNFGADHDIANIKDAITQTESKLDYKWTPTQDDNGAWIVPQ